jgi:hypothetical protein
MIVAGAVRIFAGVFPQRGKGARMKMFTFGPLILILSFTLFFCGCANQPAQTQSTQQAGVAAPMSTPVPSLRPAGGMGRGY